MIPVCLKQEGLDLMPLKPGELRHVITDEGTTYLERRSELFSTCTQVSSKDVKLGAYEEYCTLYCGKLPQHLVKMMLSFFQAAFKLHGGESALILLYHPLEKRFDWMCPDQYVESYGGKHTTMDIHFEVPLEVPEGWINFGDAHCHAECAAGVSYTDKRDEEHKDGLHIIVGAISAKHALDWHAEFVMDGQRYSLDPKDIMEGAGKLLPEEGLHPPEWMAKIEIKKISSSSGWHKSSYIPRYDDYHSHSGTKTRHYKDYSDYKDDHLHGGLSRRPPTDELSHSSLGSTVHGAGPEPTVRPKKKAGAGTYYDATTGRWVQPWEKKEEDNTAETQPTMSTRSESDGGTSGPAAAQKAEEPPKKPDSTKPPDDKQEPYFDGAYGF